MAEPLLCFRVSNQGEPILLPLKVSTMDQASALLPQGVYTTFRTFFNRTRVLGLKQHLDRLLHSSSRLGYRGTIDFGDLRIDMREALLQLPGSADARVRVSLDLAYEPGALFLIVQQLVLSPPAIYEVGVRLQSSSLHRQSPDVKSTSFLVNTRTERQAMPSGVYELLMTDDRGRILEGISSNFFAVRSGTIYTARDDILSGVTRQAVLNLAQVLGMPIVLEPFSLAAIDQLDEAFITSSSRGLVPVVQINDYVIGTGKPGPVYRRLSRAYDEYVVRMAEEI